MKAQVGERQELHLLMGSVVGAWVGPIVAIKWGQAGLAESPPHPIAGPPQDSRPLAVSQTAECSPEACPRQSCVKSSCLHIPAQSLFPVH